MAVAINDSRISGPGTKPELKIETHPMKPEPHVADPAAGLSDSGQDFSSLVEPQNVHSWEQPGAWGTLRRYLHNSRRYIWDDPDKSKEEK